MADGAYLMLWDDATASWKKGQSTSGVLNVTGAAEDVHDAAAGTTVVLVGGFASASAPAAVTGNDAARFWTTLSGALNIADAGGSITVDNGGTFAVQVDGSALTALQLLDDTVFTDDSAFTIATSKVNMAGGYAVAHSANPDAADAGDAGALLMNRHRVLFNIGGHPNVISRTAYISAATGAQTDATIVGTISAGTKVVVTSIAVTVDSATTATGGVAVKVGFGATTLPADASGGANGIILDHKGIAAGSGVVLGNGSGIIGIGADGEELRLTCEAPTGGGLSVTFTYYTIES